ncbi:MAG: zinc ABC transporter substrate-binding protein [Phycisphaerae bacterium]|nr:zinc ABC transporter substrate-binding protein [Phycisphaerae bacterium]
MPSQKSFIRKGGLILQAVRLCFAGCLTQILVFAAIMVFLACPSAVWAAKETPKINVVATIFPFADWAGQIGGERVNVVSLLPPGASPHTYELTMRDAKLLQQAHILIYNGSGLDDWAGKLVEKSVNKQMIHLALAESLPMAPMPILISEAHDEHDESDTDHHEHPHTIANCGMWLDPMRAVRMIDLIVQTLVQVDPDHQAYYQERAKRYWGQLDRLDREYRRTFQNVQGGVICLHDDLIYLFRRYNVDIYGIVELYPGKEPSLEYIRKLTDHVAGKDVLCVITEPQLSLKPAKVLAEQLRVPLMTVDPIGGKGVAGRDSYVGLMTYNLRQLAQVAKPRESTRD